MHRVRTARFDESHREIISLCPEEIGIEHASARIDKLHCREEQAHRQRHAENGHRRTRRPAGDMAQDHVADDRKTGALAEAFDRSGAIDRGRRRRHRDGRAEPDGGAHAPERAQTRRRCRERSRSDDDCGGNMISQNRKAIIFGIEARHAAPHPGAGQRPEDGSDERDRECEFEIVPADRPIRVTKSLYKPDQRSLGLDHASEHDIDEKGRYDQEHRRDDPGHRLELHQLIVEEGVAYMIGAAIGAGAAVRREERIDSPDHIGFGRAALKGQREAGNRSGTVGRRLQRLFTHPENTEPAVVGDKVAGRDRIDIVRCQPDPDDGQRLLATIDDRVEPGAEREAIGRDERLVGHDLAGTGGIGEPTGTQRQPVEQGPFRRA